jgi:hypothetical protein
MKKAQSFLIFFGSILFLSSTQAQLENVMFVGDSHAYGKMGAVVEKRLASVSKRVIIQSSCGSTPNTWLGKTGYEKTVCGYWKKDGATEIRSKEHKTPKFKSELEKYKPQLTIVQLGTNIAAGSNPLKSEGSVIEMLTLIREARGECIWIGPPDAESKVVSKEKLKKTNEMLARLAKSYDCQYIDSLLLTVFPKENKEGIHYPPKLSAEWGEKLSSKILSLLKI